MPKKTVICHIYNEEVYLPYWLSHHRDIFDHGIMVDYNSTDSSLDIVRTLTPHWEIRKSKTPDVFACDNVDTENKKKLRKVFLNGR